MKQLAILAIALVFFVGCGPSAGTAPVKGKVTLKGAPAPDGTMVTFWPVGGGETATGKVKGGEYELFSGVKGDVGAKPGKYKVVLAEGSSGDASTPDKGAYQSQGAPKKGDVPGASTGKFPTEYGTAESTPLEKEVKSGSNTIDIEVP